MNDSVALLSILDDDWSSITAHMCMKRSRSDSGSDSRSGLSPKRAKGRTYMPGPNPEIQPNRESTFGFRLAMRCGVCDGLTYVQRQKDGYEADDEDEKAGYEDEKAGYEADDEGDDDEVWSERDKKASYEADD